MRVCDGAVPFAEREFQWRPAAITGDPEGDNGQVLVRPDLRFLALLFQNFPSSHILRPLEDQACLGGEVMTVRVPR